MVKSLEDGADDDIDLDDLHIYGYADMDRGYPHIFIIRYLTGLVDCLIECFILFSLMRRFSYC